MEKFKASSHYGDWHGTSAADDGDETSLERFLEKKGLKRESEFLIAAKLFVSQDNPQIRAFFYDGGQTLESVQVAIDKTVGPIPVREVTVDLTVKEFLGLFKQFEVSLTWQNLLLGEREFRVKEEMD